MRYIFYTALVFSGGLLASAFIPWGTKVELHPPTIAVSQTTVVAAPLTLQERADRIAREMDFDPQIVHNVIDVETGGTWDCSLKGILGEIGCLQIIPAYHPEVEPTDFDASVRYFISEYKAGRGWHWTSCSCVKSAIVFGAKLPPHGNADQIEPFGGPQIGGVVLFRYKDGNAHVAYISGYTKDGTGMIVREGNYKPCAWDTRIVNFNDKSIYGYFKLPGNSS